MWSCDPSKATPVSDLDDNHHPPCGCPETRDPPFPSDLPPLSLSCVHSQSLPSPGNCLHGLSWGSPSLPISTIPFVPGTTFSCLNSCVAANSFQAHVFPNKLYATARRLFLKHPSDHATTCCFSSFPVWSGWSPKVPKGLIKAVQALPYLPFLTAPASPLLLCPDSAFPSFF